MPKAARAYILYHTMVSPQLLAWHLLPFYMFMTGYSILDVGILFTAVNVLSIPMVYLIGKAFNEYPLKLGLVLVDILDGAAYVTYGFAKGALAPVMLFVGRLLEKISSLFYPLYPAYEQIIYPEEKREKILAWHLRLPEISQLISFPAIGFLLGYVWNRPHHYRMAFLAFGLFSVFTVWYLLRFLPPVGKRERIEVEKLSFHTKKGFWRFLIVDFLFAASYALAPEIVLANYVKFKLNGTIFEVTLVEAVISLATISATFLSEKVDRSSSKKIITVGFLLLAIHAFAMSLSPPFWLVLVAYFVGRFGESLMFPFYRSWLFSTIPASRASEFHSTLSSVRRTVGIFSPLVAGALGTISPATPYLASFVLILAATCAYLLLAPGPQPGAKET